MKIKIFKTSEQLYDYLMDLLRDEINKNPKITLGLPTGATPVPLYEKMVKDYQINKTDYSNVTTFNLDEYVGLAPTHDQSYRYFMNDLLFNHINIKLENTHLPLGIADDLEKEAQNYHNLLNELQIDLQILGIGTNAHIAFNEPGTSFDTIVRVAPISEQTRLDNAKFFKSMDDVPTHAITMGIQNILNTKKVILVALGAHKADAIKNMIDGEITEEVPASILQKHENVLVLLDELAASKLKK